MHSLLLLYAASGFLSLGYQVAWFRFFTDAFGSTNQTFAFVLVQFLGGLAAGSLCSRRLVAAIAARTGQRDPLRVYGLVEIAIGFTAALTLLLPLLPASLGGAFPYTADDGILRPSLTLHVLLFATSWLAVFVPCFLMGVTFPLLCHAGRANARMPAVLYAANTLGAAAGVLACEFVLLPWLGHGAMHAVLAGANELLGGWFAAGRCRMPVAAIEPLQPAGAPAPLHGPAPHATNATNTTHRPDAPSAPVLLAIGLGSGLLTGAFEADVLRRVQFFDCRMGATLSCISFWAILGIFLASVAVDRLPRLRLRHLQAGTLLACGLYVLAWQLGYPLRDWTNAADFAAVRAAQPDVPAGLAPEYVFFPFYYGLGAMLWFTALFVLPPFFLLALWLPWACNAAQARGMHLGRLYGLNTVGFCAGMLLFSAVAPYGNQFYAMRLFLLVFALGAVLLATLRTGTTRLRWRALAAAGGVAVLALLTSSAFAPSWFEPGSAAATCPVRALRSDGAHTTFVVAEPAGDVLWFDSHRMTGDNAVAQQYMRLMAHVPLLLHERPRHALLICFGAGMTASAIAAHRTIERLDIVDLNDQVFATAPEFARTNRNVIEDPRVRPIHDDGRRFLRATSDPYDFVTSEPPPPMFPGVDRLYSTEYYEAARARLAPGGLMSQWLPIGQMPLAAMRAAIASFVHVFPECVLFVGADVNFVLMGCNGTMQPRTLDARFAAEPAVQRDLQPFGIASPRNLWLRVVQSPAQLHAFAGGRQVRDRHNVFAHAFRDPLQPAVLTFDPVGVLQWLRAAPGGPPASIAEVEHFLLHLGRLKSLVPDLPDATLASVRTAATGPVAMADVDWLLVERHKDAYARELAAKNVDAAAHHLERMLALAPGYVEAARLLGHLQLQQRRPDAALRAWSTMVAADPDEPEGHCGVALSLLQAGRRDDAIAKAAETAATFATQASVHVVHGDVLAACERWADALAAYDRALALAPADPAATAGRARCVARLGR